MATHRVGRRLMLNPYEFGALSPYEFLNNTNPDSARQTWPHFDWAAAGSGVPERSWRFWEPGRLALSELGLVESDPDNLYATEQNVQGAEIHGIKGDVYVKPVGAIFFDADTGVQFDTQPTYEAVFDAYQLNWSRTVDFTGDSPSVQQSDPAYWSTAPLFITMYHGTFSVVDDGYDEGGTISDGPFDDPDTLMSLDITNPTVLESNRMTWWASESLVMPHRSQSYSPSPESDGNEIPPLDSVIGNALFGTLGQWSQPMKKLPLSLSHNFRVGKRQVLWLHISFGLVGTPLVLADGATNRRVAYRPKAIYEIIGSMIATPFAVK